LGEPTEAALVVASAELGLTKPELMKRLPRVDEVPFDSQRKRMTTLHSILTRPADEPADVQVSPLLTMLDRLGEAKLVAFMKGAVDVVLADCRSYWIDGQARPLNQDHHDQIVQSNDQLAACGMRVLGVAFRLFDERPPTGEQLEREMVFVGMLGIIDPPRPEVKDAVARCRAAGIRPIMITGDHPLTALNIARELGITKDDRTLVGGDLADMSAADLQPAVENVSVYARVAPKDKLHIVQALQNNGQVVAMTGDGVNDAPALKQAHIGVAMGHIGTDVSKEAADMVLLDDNFATIVNAVEEGRIVYDNVRKFVKYTMTSNAGEVCVMVIGPLLGMPLPLLPLQILWINLVTDGLPGLALSIEPAERDTMRRAPYPPEEHIMGRGMWREIAWVGLLMGAVSLAMGYVRWSEGIWEDAHWRTLVFTVLTLSQMGNALATRSARDSLFQIGLLSNKALLASVVLTFILQMAVIYLPPLQAIFKTTALSITELLWCLLLSTTVFWTIEAKKFVSRIRS
jgi:Ca2+-transporting ATPase